MKISIVGTWTKTSSQFLTELGRTNLFGCSRGSPYFMAKPQVGVLVPLNDSDGLEQSINLFEGLNPVGRSDLAFPTKQVSRKHVTIHASSDGHFQITVEGQNPVILSRGSGRRELKSQEKSIIQHGDVVEILPGKHAFKLNVNNLSSNMNPESSSGKRKESSSLESHDEEKRLLKKQELEDEALARALQAIEDENAQNSHTVHTSGSRPESSLKVEKSLNSNDTSNHQRISVDCNPRTFKLLRVRGLPSWANKGCVGIQDVIQGDIQFALLSNYMFDIEWLLSACPLLIRVPKVLVVHGDSVERLKADRPSEWLLHKPPLPLSYGTHHSKAMILVYPTGVRVVIHTANLIHVDWNNKTQGLWMQDFPYKKQADRGSTSPFEEDLIDYLEALQWSGCNMDLPNRGNNRIDANFFKKFDFRSAQVRIIASVPGYHQGSRVNRWGHMKLRCILEKQQFDETFLQSSIVYQFSSLGSLDEKWLAEFNNSTSAGRTCQGEALGPGNVQIIWPTVEDVRCSIEGYAAGNAIPSPLKNVEKGFLKKYWSRWEADHSGRSRAMPHFKSYVRYSGQHIAWFLLTSSNLSKAAWGALQKNGTQLMIRSYELGVLFLPSTQNIGSTFSCTGSQLQRESYIMDQDQAPVNELGSSNNCQTVKFVTSDFKNSENELKLHNVLELPVPYKLPPKQYVPTDVPWCWDRHYSKPDTYGQVWPR